jgi:hypothetical protein
VETSGQYELRYNFRFVDALGDGKDGRVLKTADGQAVKFFKDEAIYRRELRAYQILGQRDIDELNGFQIPRLLRFDDALLAIEMTIVAPPFLLDFASAYTQHEYDRFEFTQEVLDERQAHWSEIFADDWPTVQLTSEAFTNETSLILLDLSLNNIRFAKK